MILMAFRTWKKKSLHGCHLDSTWRPCASGKPSGPDGTIEWKLQFELGQIPGASANDLVCLSKRTAKALAMFARTGSQTHRLKSGPDVLL